MIDPTTQRQTTKRRRVWLISGLLVAVIVAAFGVYRLMRSPVDDVKWAYLMPAIPGATVLPLFPDRDQDRETIANALILMQQAQDATDENLQIPRQGGAFVIDMKDGHSVSVEYAQSCKQNGDLTQCTIVPDRVLIRDSNRKPNFYFAKSIELYRLLQTEFQKNATNRLQDQKYPHSEAVGSTFQAEGDGWMTDKVTVRLKKDNQVLWSTDAVPDHGHISVQVKCPADVTPGDYTLEYAGQDWRTISGNIHFYK